MPQAARKIADLEKPWYDLLEEHDRLASCDPPLENGELDALDDIADTIAGMLREACSIAPLTDHEAALLLRMALVDMGVDSDNEDSSARAAYSVVHYLERTAGMWLAAAASVGVVCEISRWHLTLTGLA